MKQDDRRPPFRAEHIGRFPRPERLLRARQDYTAGKILKEDLKRTEADCIREIVLLQERLGIGAVTDGEYPKTSWREFLLRNAMALIRNRLCQISSSSFMTGRNSTTRVSRV
jgi:methionine synthase II (cobalamin-independent)